MKKFLKENLTKGAICTIILLIVVTLGILGGSTYSKYFSKIEGEGSGTVAKWSFKANSQTKTIENIKLNNTYNETKLAKNKIAPGTSGSFDIVLDTTGSDVAIDYTVTFDNCTNKPANLKYITIKEVGENYSKRMANLMFELGYGEWIFRDYGQIDKMQEQMIEILQDDDDLKEILNRKRTTQNNLFKQIEGYILKGEIEESIYNKEECAEFIKEKINEYLTGGWLKQNEFDFLSTNLSELSEKCFNELRDDMSLEEELNMIDKNIKSMLEGITENMNEER